MTEELEAYEVFANRMEEKYPKIFEKPYGGFCIGEGWYPIVESLCANIQSHIDWKAKQGHHVPQVTVAQIKEKFGGLRFYYEGGDDAIDGMVRMAESWADAICETCGKPATQKTSGWIKNVCQEHFDQIENARKERLTNDPT